LFTCAWSEDPVVGFEVRRRKEISARKGKVKCTLVQAVQSIGGVQV